MTDSKPVKTKVSALDPFLRLQGHSGNIEDLVFRNDSGSELVSVGVDRYILFWDIRVGNSNGNGAVKPVMKAVRVHFDDINTVDWCKTDTNLIATGSNDKKVAILDIRKLGSDAENGTG